MCFVANMIMITDIVLQMNNQILINMDGLFQKFFAIHEYLEGNECSIEQPHRELCSQLISIQLFANFFYSIYLASLNGALNSKELREQQAHLKYVNAYIIEGYKALWGYKKNNKSLWGRFIKYYTSVKDTNTFDDRLITITNSLKAYKESKVTDKDERDLAMHYQLDKGSSPRELLKLDEITLEKELERYNQFGSVFRMLIGCVTEMINYYWLPKNSDELMMVRPVLPPLTTIDQCVWRSKIGELDTIMTRNINSQSQCFLECKDQLIKWPKILKHFKDKYNVDLNDCYEVLPTAEAMLAVSYMSLDLCATIKRYLDSAIPIERAIVLSRMNIICYSIIDRVYGYTTRSGSYWERYLTKPYSGHELPDSLVEIKNAMESCISANLYSDQKRSTFVHLKKDNYILAIKLLYTQNPFEEIQNSITIIKVLPLIQKAISESLKQIDDNIKSRNAKKYEWVDKLIVKLNPYKDEPEIQILYKSLMEMKEGNFLEGLEILAHSV